MGVCIHTYIYICILYAIISIWIIWNNQLRSHSGNQFKGSRHAATEINPQQKWAVVSLRNDPCLR